MSARIIDGKAVAASLREQVAREVAEFGAGRGAPPGLATVLIGDDPASEIYVSSKRRVSGELGIQSFHHPLPASVTEAEVLELIDTLNADDAVSGILCQLPVPDHLNGAVITNRIDPDKDVDGLTVANAGRLALGLPGLRPCTPAGVMVLLDGIPVEGAEAV